MSSQSLSDMRGGLFLKGYKTLSCNEPLRQAPMPEQLVLPVKQHIGDAAEPCVKVGERVLKGQEIADATGYISVPIHASTSGTVTAIEERPVPHPSGLSALCIVIDVDGKDEAIDYKPEAQYEYINPGHLRNIIRHAGIVGLGGAGFPTFVKMNPGPMHRIQTLILNGAECEPYITCDDVLMRERAHEIISGAAILRHALQAERCVIAIEDNKPVATRVMQDAANGAGVEVISVPTRYPMGGEKQLIQVITGQEVPSHGLPAELGVVMQNVATAAAVHRAVEVGEPLISRLVTVTGKGVGQPGNYEVMLGMSVQSLLESCGGPSEDTTAVVMGGSMMGVPIHNTLAPVIKTANCFIAAAAGELEMPGYTQPCIRCGRCHDACPVGLLPQQLYWYARARDMERVQEYNLFDCIECGCCAYVCPSRIPLVGFYRYAKTEIAAQERDRRRADIARMKHEAHLARVERDKQEREAKRQAKKAALANAKKQEKKPAGKPPAEGQDKT